MGYVILVILSLAGFSAGRALTSGKKQPVPKLLDLLLVVCLWIVLTLLFKGAKTWASAGICLGMSLIIGAAISLVQNRVSPAPLSRNSPPGDTGGLWERWKKFALRMGNFQSRVLLGLFYFVFFLPTGVIMKLSSSEKRIQADKILPVWEKRSLPTHSIEASRNQY